MPNSVMIGGPPSSLEQLKGSVEFKELKLQNVPLPGPYHAPHLHSLKDIEEIVGNLTCPDGNRDPCRVSVLSGDGEKVQGADFTTILKAAVGQILRRQINWNGILNQLLICQENTGHATLNVTMIGMKTDQFVYNALKQTPLRSYLSSNPTQTKQPVSDEDPDPLNGRQKLAIVGMSGRFPGADDIEGFWQLLEQGLDVHKTVPSLRWDARTHVDPARAQKNTSGTPFGCWLDHPDLFDARFFNISPREAPQIDPAQRLALMTAYEAIEQAGLVPDATPSTRRDRVGVFYGTTSNDWMETNSAQNIDTYFIPGGNRAFVPGRINYYFKFSGPSYAVDTACSSSLAGIHLACNSLLRREIDTAITGGMRYALINILNPILTHQLQGTNVLTNPDFTAGLDRGQFLSRTGNCKTFDDSADGYCRGEGVGTVIIKRLEDAQADNDPILGVILSASTNHSAESDSITRPHVGAQREILEHILNQGATKSSSVGYVEMHGTGTQIGDASEMSSVLETFAPAENGSQRGRGDENPLYLGSAKANIGHGEAVSGVSSLIKVLLMLQKNMIVPHCGIKTKINHKFPTDFNERNAHIASKPTPWKRNPAFSQTRRVVVNNFSAAGGNTALLVEDGPLKRESQNETAEPRSHHIVAISAKSGASLQGNIRSMLKFLKENPEVHLGKLSYTTTARRLHHPHRVMLTGSKVEEVAVQVQAALDEKTGMTRPKGLPKVVFAFTGQGAYYPGMGKELLETFSVFRNEIYRLNQLGQTMGFPSMLPVLQSGTKEIDIGAFEPTAVQLAGICIQMALCKLWASWNIIPTAVFGHSIGEYPALNIAGVLSDADTIYLVGKRAQLLEKKCSQGTHSMLVIKASVDQITAALNNREYYIACINSPVETVLAATNEELHALKEILTAAGFKSTPLKVPYAFHSPQVDPMLADFENVASGVVFLQAKIPLLSALDGNVHHGTGAFDAEYLIRHTREPVSMYQALLTAGRENIISESATVLEIGSHPAISGMVKAVLGPQIPCLATLSRGRPTFQILAATLKNLYMQGADICWAQYHLDANASHEVLPLPSYSWDLKPYWIQYVNDWSLRKGDAPQSMQTLPTLESTTIHRVIEETGDSTNTRIVVEADISRKDLSPLVQGHEVDGIPLCTPSVYADMALTLGTYLLKKYHPDQTDNLVDVTDMVISKALILRTGDSQQLLQAHAEADWGSNAMNIIFKSFDVSVLKNYRLVYLLLNSELTRVENRPDRSYRNTLDVSCASKTQISSKNFKNTLPM
jgi:acyl transferase domain-containing protein